MYVWAAKRGHGGALLEMAHRYDKGIFVEENLSEAHRLAKLAEKHGVKEGDISDKISLKARNATPSMIKPSGIDENPDEKLPEFLKNLYIDIVERIQNGHGGSGYLIGYDDLVDGEVKKKITIKQREKAKASRQAAAREKKAAEQRKSKERKDAIQGCGCLLAIIAAVAFGIWWWIEGFSMAAITDLWKSANKDGSLGTGIMVLGGLVTSFIGWKRFGKGDSGESTSPKKRWKFITLGVLLGFFGAHLAYAKRWVLFLLLWGGLITGNVMSGDSKEQIANPEKQESVQTVDQVEPNQSQQNTDAGKERSSPIGNIGFAVWGLLWIGGTLFIKKDGNGCRM
jgi:F0F1-type ATP synthase assembly protein I